MNTVAVLQYTIDVSHENKNYLHHLRTLYILQNSMY